MSIDALSVGFNNCTTVQSAAVAEGLGWSSSNLKVGSSIPSLPKSACRSVLEQDAEP